MRGMDGSGRGTDRVRVEVMRGGRPESEHEVELAVVDAGGAVVAATAGADAAVFVRSAIKPFQALPLLEDGVADRLGLSEEELALCCASHSGEARHVAVAAGLLEKIGVTEDALACGPHEPFSSAATAALRAEGREPGRIHNNCSGKHAGMLALARGHDWPVADYHRLEHPVQQRILGAVEEWTGVDRSAIGTGVDGCGVVTFALPLSAMAGALARLAAAAAEGESPAGRVVGAMVRHPFLVAGTGRLCTALMEATDGRILAKVGAEGVYGAAALDRAWGIALKVRDGARRGAEVALVGVLEALELLHAEEVERLAEWARPAVRNTRGDVVGEVQSRVEVSIGR